MTVPVALLSDSSLSAYEFHDPSLYSVLSRLQLRLSPRLNLSVIAAEKPDTHSLVVCIMFICAVVVYPSFHLSTSFRLLLFVTQAQAWLGKMRIKKWSASCLYEMYAGISRTNAAVMLGFFPFTNEKRFGLKLRNRNTEWIQRMCSQFLRSYLRLFNIRYSSFLLTDLHFGAQTSRIHIHTLSFTTRLGSNTLCCWVNCSVYCFEVTLKEKPPWYNCRKEDYGYLCSIFILGLWIWFLNYTAQLYFSIFSAMMILYTLYMQPSYGKNQTDLQMEITLVCFSKTGKLRWPFWYRRRNTKKPPAFISKTWTWCYLSLQTH